MNRKKFFVAALALNTAMLAFAVCVYNLHASQTHRGERKDSRPKALTGESGKFGPVIETVLLAANINGTAQILDLETGRVLPEPLPEAFGFRANAIMAWIRGKGLDISCSVWPDGGTACVTYEMTLLPVERKCWNETTEAELLHNEALAPRPHSPRRQLVLARNRPDTYVFRTGEGTLGMLRLDGLSQDGRGVKIRYKLINPASSFSVVP